MNKEKTLCYAYFHIDLHVLYNGPNACHLEVLFILTHWETLTIGLLCSATWTLAMLMSKCRVLDMKFVKISHWQCLKILCSFSLRWLGECPYSCQGLKFITWIGMHHTWFSSMLSAKHYYIGRAWFFLGAVWLTWFDLAKIESGQKSVMYDVSEFVRFCFSWSRFLNELIGRAVQVS